MTRMMLALMLYFLILAHKASCYTLSKAFLVYGDMVVILLMLQIFLAEDPETEYLFCGAPSDTETCLHFCNDLVCLRQESVSENLHDLTRMADKSDGSIVLALLQVAFRWECDNQRLSQCGRPFPCLPNLVAD